MENSIDEELRQYKLQKLQQTEVKLEKFHTKYQEIEEHITIKFSKNFTSNICRLILTLLSLAFLFLGIFLSFPEKVIEVFADLEPLTSSEKKEFIEEIRFIRPFCFLLFLLLSFTSRLLKLNNRKRNNIYSLSKLLEEMIEYMVKVRDEELKQYEQFVDYITEKKNQQKITKTNEKETDSTP